MLPEASSTGLKRPTNGNFFDIPTEAWPIGEFLPGDLPLLFTEEKWKQRRLDSVLS